VQEKANSYCSMSGLVTINQDYTLMHYQLHYKAQSQNPPCKILRV